MNSTFRLTYSALLIALSLSLFLLEGFIPLPFITPGAKLGLSNIVTVVALYTLPKWQPVLFIVMARVLLSALWSGGVTIWLYSVSGALLSLGLMILLKKSNYFSLLGVSAAGGFFHNFGQLLVAVSVMNTSGLWNYLPILGTMGIITGLIIGTICYFTLNNLFRQKKLL